MTAHCAECKQHFQAVYDEVAGGYPQVCGKCSARLTSLVDHFADEILETVEEWLEAEVTHCPVCGGAYELSGPQGVVPHTLQDHPDSMFAQVTQAVLGMAS